MVIAKLTNFTFRFKVGTEESGHFQHQGRVGRVGGSLPGSGGRRNPPPIEMLVVEQGWADPSDYNGEGYTAFAHVSQADQLRRYLRRMRGDRRDYWIAQGQTPERANELMLAEVRNAYEQVQLREHRAWLQEYYDRRMHEHITGEGIADDTSPEGVSVSAPDNTPPEGVLVVDGITGEAIRYDAPSTPEPQTVGDVIIDADEVINQLRDIEAANVQSVETPAPVQTPNWNAMTEREQATELRRMISRMPSATPEESATLTAIDNETRQQRIDADAAALSAARQTQAAAQQSQHRATAEEVRAGREAAEAAALQTRAEVDAIVSGSTVPDQRIDIAEAQVASAPQQYQNQVMEFMQDWASIPENITDDQVKLNVNFSNIRSNTVEELQNKYKLSPNDIKKMMYIEGMRTEVSVSEGYGGLHLEAYVYEPNEQYSSIGKIEYTFSSDRGDPLIDASGNVVYDEGGNWVYPNPNPTNFRASYMRFDDNYLNRGWGTKLAVRSTMQAKAAGYKIMYFNADITIGKYSWAKEGAVFAQSNKDREARAKLYKFAKVKIFGATPYITNEDAEQRFPDFKKFKRAVRKLKTAYDFATFNWKDFKIAGRDIRNDAVPHDMQMNVGKAFMLDDYLGMGSWDARVDLTTLGGF